MASTLHSERTLQRVRTGARVAVVRMRSMGDCVLTTPALELLKNYRPDLEIGVVVEDRFAAIFEGNPAVSAILSPSYGEILRWRPALCLNLHGGTRSQLLTVASLAGVRAGFGHHRGAVIYNVKIPRAQQVLGVERTTHTAEQLASAVFHLGVPIAEVPRARLFAEPLPAGRPYAVIHPTAAMAYKVWQPDRFLQVAEHLERKRGLEPVVIGAGAAELAPFSHCRTVAGAPLGRVMSLLAGASLFVGSDSGPAHIACAFGVPVVVLFGRMDLEVVWSPWRAVAARTLSSPEGIAAIQIRDVIAAIGELADTRGGDTLLAE
jgi:heptosyltransferase III